MTEPKSTAVPEPPSKEELRLAMKAFRKRLRLTRLDDEAELRLHHPVPQNVVLKHDEP